MPGARYARRPISGLRAAFGGWPPKRGLRTAVAGAPPRDPGLSPLRGPGPAGRIHPGWPAAKSPSRPPRRLRLAFGQSRRRPGSRMSGWVHSTPPAAAPRAQCLCLRDFRYRPGSASGEALPPLHGAQRPRGGGKLRPFAAHAARKARERPERALFSAGRFCRAFRQPLLGERNLPYQKRPSSRTAAFL